MSAKTTLPATHKALLFHSVKEPLQLTELPTPSATCGSAVVQVLTAGILSYQREIFTGKRPYPYPEPYTPGAGAIGRIAAVGPDASTLRPGDLVLVDCYLVARDNQDARCLQGVNQGGTAASAALVEQEWRHGAWAEYAKAPLENCYKLPDDKSRNLNDWVNLNRMLVPFGGLTDNGGLDLRPSETVVIAPATGQFGGAGVEVALAMGAKVIGLGRNPTSLKKLETALSMYGSRFRAVPITGDVDADAKAIGPVDCYLDLSPPTAASSSHIKSCFQALKPKGRVCLMGGILDTFSIPHRKIMREGISITGKWMYEKSAILKLVALADMGLLDLSRNTCHEFTLERWSEALETAENESAWGSMSVFRPDVK